MAITVPYISWEIMHNKLFIIPCKYLFGGIACVLNISKVCNYIRSNTDEHIFHKRGQLSNSCSHFLLIDKTYCQLFH